MSQVRVAEKKRGRRAYAAVGFILIIAIAVIVFVVTPPLTAYLDTTFLRRYSIPRKDLPTVQLLVGLVLFFIGSTITALIVSLFAPKKMINVKETDLVKERDAMVKQRKADRVRQRKINRDFRDFREGKVDEKGKPKKRR
ncbi:MAG: hypothetical protein SGI73_08770 [Chloroflexota bacterium]|nr:hypothetical protein [Chloroflexota bacterium]